MEVTHGQGLKSFNAYSALSKLTIPGLNHAVQKGMQQLIEFFWCDPYLESPRRSICSVTW